MMTSRIVPCMLKPRVAVHSSASSAYPLLIRPHWPFDIEQFLNELEQLHARGARLFKFVDRTFNLNIKTSLKRSCSSSSTNWPLIQMIPCLHTLKWYRTICPRHCEGIQKFPEGCLQFEIGIQSFNPEVQARISRKQNNEKATRKYPLAGRAFDRASACRFDCWASSGNHRQFCARLQSALCFRAARDSIWHLEAPARYANYPAHRRLPDAL